MALTSEDELKDLKEKNNELAQKVQYWKMTAAQRENEKLSLMKEINELRLKLSRIRSNSSIKARQLDNALQSASEEAISHLVKASAEIAKSMELAKAYMQDRQELDCQSPRWSITGSAERKEKVHRVPPMMGGQSIQPVVALSRTLLNTSNPRTPRSPNQNHSITERAVPMHMLQDVYIPLTRIDADLHANNMEVDSDTNNAEDSATELGLDSSGERLDESGNMSDEEDFEERRLQTVSEEEGDIIPVTPSPRHRNDSPLEGPSWLLDSPPNNKVPNRSMKLEPDSTTELETNRTPNTLGVGNIDTTEVVAFSPTVRRRRSSPRSPALHYSPRPSASRRNSINGRVLKVLVAKMRVEETPSPLRKRPRDMFDAPSPNGATDSAVIVSETRNKLERGDNVGVSKEACGSRTTHDGDTHNVQDLHRNSQQQSRLTNMSTSRVSHDSRDSDSGSGHDTVSEGRVRRTRKNVTYKEKPLNRKMRR